MDELIDKLYKELKEEKVEEEAGALWVEAEEVLRKPRDERKRWVEERLEGATVKAVVALEEILERGKPKEKLEAAREVLRSSPLVVQREEGGTGISSEAVRVLGTAFANLLSKVVGGMVGGGGVQVGEGGSSRPVRDVTPKVLMAFTEEVSDAETEER